MNKQPNSEMCFVCGRSNPVGLYMQFEDDGELEVVSNFTVPAHYQGYPGIVHGGVLAGMIESLCSTGAALSVIAEGKSTVGLENTTSFLRAVRSGRLRCTARPLVRGRRSHVWEAVIHDEAGRLRLLFVVHLAHDNRPTVLARIRSKSMSAPRPGRSIAWTSPSTISISGVRPYFWAPAGSSTSKNSVFGIAIAT